MKYLKDKPVASLRDDQFLKLVMAEEEKLIELHLGDSITNYSGQNYVEEAKGLYCRVRFNPPQCEIAWGQPFLRLGTSSRLIERFSTFAGGKR